MKRALAITVATTMLSSVLWAQPAMAGADEVPTTAEVVVKLSADTTASIDAIAEENDGYVISPLIESRGVYLLGLDVFVNEDKIEKETDDEAEKWAKDLEKEDGVAWVEPRLQEEVEDTRFHAWPEDAFEDIESPEQLNEDIFAYLELSEAHEFATGAGAVVAVLDSGIDAAHPLLEGRLLEGVDLIGDDLDPTDERNGVDDDGDGLVDEAYGHGTFVAGVIAQVAPDAMILPIRVLDADGRASVYGMVEGIDLAIERGAKVINLSASLLSDAKPDTLKDAIKRAKDADVIVIAAAGNTADDRKLYPGSESSVISVGALDIDDDDEVTGFSAHGNWVLLAAPGVGIVSAVPGGGYAEWTGTSMAAPIVAGQAALLVEVDPDVERKDLEKALKDSAKKMPGKQRAEKGIIDILESLNEL